MQNKNTTSCHVHVIRATNATKTKIHRQERNIITAEQVTTWSVVTITRAHTADMTVKTSQLKQWKST